MHSLISSGLRRFRLRECPRKLRATFLFNWMLAVEYWNQKVILLRILWTRSWSLNCHRSLRSNCSWKEALTRTTTTTTTKRLLAWTGIEPIALHTAPPSELSNDLGTDHLNHNVLFRKRKLLANESLTGDLSFLYLASRNNKEGINAIHYGEQSLRSGDGTRLPRICPCLDSRTDCRMWMEFVGCCDS